LDQRWHVLHRPLPVPRTRRDSSEFVSRDYIARYTALLFIRQYFLVSQWYGYEPVSQPQGPGTQDERTVWIQYLPHFKKLVDEIQKNKALLEALGYEPITNEWAQQHHKPTPTAIIDQLLINIQTAYAAAEVEQEAEEDKKRAFRETSAQIIDARIQSYNNIQNAKAITVNFKSNMLRGGYVLYHKAAFASNQGTTYLNYDSFFANEIASQFTRQLTSFFRSKVIQSYLFRAPQFFEAVDKLRLNANQHVLLNFGVSIEAVNQQYGIDRLTLNSYKGIPIITVRYVGHSSMRSSFIAMKRTDLPSFIFHPPKAEDIDRFHLARMSGATELHAAVVDLNQEQNLKALFPNEQPDTLDTSVLLVIELNAEIRWKNKIKMLRLSMYSDFYQHGSVNDLTEVKRF